MKAENLESVYIDKHYDLVVECKQGSKKACYDLYRLYSKAMLNVAFRIVGDIGDAEDILQESFVDAFSKLKDFRQETTFGLWLKQIVINRSVNLLRKRRVEWISLDDEHIENLSDVEVDDGEDVQYKVLLIKEAMKELPDGYRTVLSLYLVEGFDQEEIASIMGITHSTIRTQYMRAKQRLISHLKAT